MNMTLEDIRNPESHISNPEVDEISHESSSPEDLSSKNNLLLLPCVSELSLTDVATIPSPSPLNAFSVELEVTSQQISSKPSTSRQNLETIVEAIRHVEGDHMFRDDPTTPQSPINQWTDEDNAISVDKELGHQTLQVLTNQDFSFQHQIIRNAPVTQSRPGVIVSNHS